MGKTIDGGNTWNVLNYPFDDIVSVSFVNDNTGYVSMLTASGNLLQSHSGSKLIKTTDGGNSWQIIQFKIQLIIAEPDILICTL